MRDPPGRQLCDDKQECNTVRGHSEANTKINLPQSDAKKEPDDWVSGDDPMTGAQISHLKTLSEQCAERGGAVFNRTSLRPKRPNGSTRLSLSEDQVQQR
jgi:hypothetical protein